MYGDNTCQECGREFITRWRVDTYLVKNANRFVTDAEPESDTCPFCEGKADCSEKGCNEPATVLDTEGGDAYCAAHWTDLCEENGETEEECEEFCLRLPSPAGRAVIE